MREREEEREGQQVHTQRPPTRPVESSLTRERPHKKGSPPCKSSEWGAPITMLMEKLCRSSQVPLS